MAEPPVLDRRPVKLEELYIHHDSDELLQVENREANIIECLTRIVDQFPPEKPQNEESGKGLFEGGQIGLTYVFMHVHLGLPTLDIRGKLPIDWASLYLSTCNPSTTLTPDMCGINNDQLCFYAISAALSKSLHFVNLFLEKIDFYLSVPSACNGWYSGRAGQLYLIRLVRFWYPEAALVLNPFVVRITERILENGPPWPIYGYDTIGAAHGRMGVVTQIVLTDASYAPRLVSVVEEVLGWQLDSGNWPNTVPGSSDYYKDYLVQFCHGAVGVLIALETIRPFFPSLQQKIESAVVKARKLIWEKGLLRKEPSLCHGIVGNAFAFPPGRERDYFLAHATEEKVRKGLESGAYNACNYDMPSAVGVGSTGRVMGWLWKDEKAGKIFAFNDV